MGVVYKAQDMSLDRPVALKFLAAHLVSDEDVRRRFERQAKAAAALNHPNICTVREIAEANRLVKHARYYWLLLAEGHLNRRLLGDMLRRIWALPLPGG